MQSPTSWRRRKLGDDALESWSTSCAAQADAFRAPAALEQQIDHPFGALSGREFLKFRVFDITLHAWDLARSVGADERLDTSLIDVVLDVVEHGPPGMGFGIAALGTTSSAASPQERLLDLTGRS
jgi:uncharacterized protein (TIGR03086 family)